MSLIRSRTRTIISSEDDSSSSTETTAKKSLVNDKSNQNRQVDVVKRPLLSLSLSQRAMLSTANLAKLLPSGTLLAFQLLTPIFTNNGSCDTTTRTLTLGLQVLLAISCFLACFTDSLRGPDGQVYFGFATTRGMWLFDRPSALASGVSSDLSKYKLRFMDGIHAVMSVLVYGAVALKDRNVVRCFYPKPEQQTQEVLDVVPIAIGIVCSLLFMVFPTTRHGVGYPITSVS
ncbi:hypothetical protein Dimus_018006 [Dionaea muscipula]